MSKNYSHSYYLEAQDIAELIETYHQAYLEKYPDHFLAHQDTRFWLNEAGELIFYAGEQALLDTSTEKNIQPLGRGLYDATLTLAARFLELDLPELPAENLHILSLINLDRGHWTSVILSIEDLDQEKYSEIYESYQAFKKYLKEHHPNFELVRGEQSCTNLFVQYATGNRFGSAVGIQNRTDTEELVRAFFESMGKHELLKIKQKEGEARYLEGNLELVLSPKNPKDVALLHFDSAPSSSTNKRIEKACARFLDTNKVPLMHAENLVRQSGATCGEHAILNPLRYIFFELTNVVPSSDLRAATNYFCKDFAKLFLFDFKPDSFKQNFSRILNEQKLKEKEAVKKNLTDRPTLNATAKQPDKINKIDTGEFLAYGIYIGICLTLISLQVIAPIFLGIVNPFYAGMFSLAFGIGCAEIVKAFGPEAEEHISEIKRDNVFTQKNQISKEQKLLEKLSKKTFEKEYSPSTILPEVPNKTFTPLSSSSVTTPTLEEQNKPTEVERKGMKID